MKIRVTIVVGNDHHIPNEQVTEANIKRIEKVSADAWSLMLNTLAAGDETIDVEKCEVIET